jgi:hypothetical protein
LCEGLGRAVRQGEVEPARAARVLHDLGLSRAQVDDLEGAMADLRAAAGAAGPGEVRRSALYAAGTARLLRAEVLRCAVPEIAAALGLPEPQAAPDEAGPDALEIARAAYQSARADLLERLRVDARHEDTRANLELVTRRLRELERLQQEREQQEQQQQQQPQEQQEQQDPQQKEQQPQEQQPDPQDQPPQDTQQGQQDEPQDEPEESPAEPEEAPAPPEEQAQEPQPQEAQEGQVEERVLSREEVQRLLDQLAEIEEEGRAVRERLRERRRKPVDKDW